MTTTDTRRADPNPPSLKEAPGGHQNPHRATTSSAPAYETRGEDQNARPAARRPMPTESAPGGRNDTPADRMNPEPRTRSVGEGQNTRPAKVEAAPILMPPGGSDSLADRSRCDVRIPGVGEGHDSGTGQRPTGDRKSPAGAAQDRPAGAARPLSPETSAPRLGDDPGPGTTADTRDRPTGVAQVRPAEAASAPTPVVHAPRLDDPTLNAAAALVDDIERTRIAAEHRLRILTRPTDEADEDGLCRGHGVPEDHPTPAALRAVAEALAGVEHQAVLELQRAMRRHPLGPWVKGAKGVGEKQGARLLAAVGDPYWNARDQKPRTVSALWAYCGLHTLPASQEKAGDHVPVAGGDQAGGDPGPWTSDDQRRTARVAARRRKGERANWSTTAKTRAYLVAVSCMKSPGSPYRDVYLARREHTAMTHPEWTAGHSHNDALRIVAKRVLRDAWRAARDIHLAAAEAAA